MKMLPLLILVLVRLGCNAQILSMSMGLERNVAGMESQFTMGGQNSREWMAGVFYQNKSNMFFFENSMVTSGSEWYGLFFSAPLVKADKISLHAQLRTGLINSQFLLLAPSLETRVRITKWLDIGIGSSYRHGYPTFLFKTQITLFKPDTP